jgi:hypothetical protein
MGLFNGYCCLIPGSQFEQSLAVVRVGWNFKSFFLAPAAPGGAFPVERSGITTASGTPNLITAFTSPCPVRPWSHRWHKKLLAATPLEIQPYSLQQAIVRFK